MFCNIGPVERIVRLLLAGAAAVPVISGRQSPEFRRWAAIAAGAELFTAVTRFCPANAMFGINRCQGPGLVRRLARLAVAGAGIAYLLNLRMGEGRASRNDKAMSPADGVPALQSVPSRALPEPSDPA